MDGRTGRGSDEELDATDGVDLEFELEHVHTELRNFLQKKRARKIMAGGFPGGMDSGAVIGGGGGAQGVGWYFPIFLQALIQYSKQNLAIIDLERSILAIN